jgi:FAD/FMN-containing dehydrogenase
VHDGVVIDMSLMRQVEVSADSKAAAVASGATSADVIAATEPYGLATSTGVVGEMGMVGLALGGGYGPLNGTAGLTLDNVAEVQIVLAGPCRARRLPPIRAWAGNCGSVGRRRRCSAIRSRPPIALDGCGPFSKQCVPTVSRTTSPVIGPTPVKTSNASATGQSTVCRTYRHHPRPRP